MLARRAVQRGSACRGGLETRWALGSRGPDGRRRTWNCLWTRSSRRGWPSWPSEACARRCAAAARRSPRARSSHASFVPAATPGFRSRRRPAFTTRWRPTNGTAFSERPRRVRIPRTRTRSKAPVSLTPEGFAGATAKPGSGARARAARAARRSRQLLLLRARRRAERLGSPVIQGFGTFTRAAASPARLPFRRWRRRPRPGRASTSSCRRVGRRGTARPRTPPCPRPTPET